MSAEEPPPGASRLYRTIWRWHFYAGLICLPFFILLASTGALYLFRDDLAPLLEHRRLVVEATAAPSLPPEVLIARALAAQPGTPIRFTPPPAPDRSAEVGIRDGRGEVVSVFLVPSTGRVLDRVADDQRPMTLISHIHSLEILGKAPNLVIEVVAGWAILLVASGVFLW
ncbi:MAG TPA: PepSY domain-containing protein, partial [Caulobacter sp.]|nr:PepSY domain-containing protein [Caulobacter sp.]